MRLQQITKEERLDEFVPIAFGAIMAGLTAYFAVTTAYDVWKIFQKAGYDPDKMTEKDWEDLTWEVLPLMIPAFGKYIGKGVKAITPLRVRRKLAVWVKGKMNKITGGFKKDRPKDLTGKKDPGKKDTGTGLVKSKEKPPTSAGKSLAKSAAKIAGTAYGVKKAVDYISNKSDSGAGSKPSPGADYAANREPGQPFGQNAAPGTDWDPLGTMARLNKIYGK